MIDETNNCKEAIPMAKTMCIILGLAFLALGILGITGVVPMFTSDPNYVNIGEIVLGGLGVLIGIYARQGRRYDQQTKEISRQTKDNIDRQRQENEQLKKENEQLRNENIDRQQKENELLRKQLEEQKQENERLSKHDES
jgi:membrane protein involved in colicin uptake